MQTCVKVRSRNHHHSGKVIIIIKCRRWSTAARSGTARFQCAVYSTCPDTSIEMSVMDTRWIRSRETHRAGNAEEILQPEIRSHERLLENFTLSTEEDPLRQIESRLWVLMRGLRAIEPRHFWRRGSSFLAQENVIRVKVGLLHDDPPGALPSQTVS